ncbi:MAG: oxygen-independent coproporphyrinogen III oxidase [Pseudomonadota bacterium]
MRNSWRHHLAARAPRYTSYPSALLFTNAVGSDAYAARLSAIAPYEPFSVYVHVPFCHRQCWYCGCNMRVENNYDRALDYVSALLKEIETVGALLSGRGRLVSLHFGGGTPNYLNTDDLGRILDAVELAMGLTDDATRAIELDPRMVGEHDLDRLTALGFNRVSIGVQDFDPDVQAAINRETSFETVEQCVSAARAAALNDLSFDLLYGLPRQTTASFSETIDKVLALAPERAAVFGYAHMPSVLPRQRLIDSADLPSPAARAALAELADRRFCDAGYRRVGFDHYAKPGAPLADAAQAGRLRRNFQGFTEDAAAAIIGLGASAVSFVDGLYAQNAKNIGAYKEMSSAGALATEKGYVRTPRDQLFAGVFEDLLCERPAAVDSALDALPSERRARVLERLRALQADGAVEWDGHHLKLADDAWPLARSVAASLDPYCDEEALFSAAL